MNLRELWTEDDAVSPVIGVILMVAVTVILAAVIASFVLGLGDQAQQSTPQASFSFDYEPNSSTADWGNLTVTHEGGDSIKVTELYIRGQGINNSFPAGPSIDHTDSGPWNGTTSTTIGDTDAASAGDYAEVAVDSTYKINIVYESSSNDNSVTLARDSGPDA